MGCLDVAISKSIDGRGMNHWAIHLFLEDKKGTVYEAAGDPEDYFFNVITDYNPRETPGHWRSIPVCDGLDTEEMAQFDSILRTIPVDNESYNFNCQVWVFDALEKLFEGDLISDCEYAEAYETLMALHYDTQGEADSDD
jgi:hypothetical protein